MARKVIAHLFSSVNGVSESPNEWQFDAFGPEEGEMLGTTIATVTDAVMGRTLWQEWSGFWPSMNDGFADFINAVPKHVAANRRRTTRRSPGSGPPTRAQPNGWPANCVVLPGMPRRGRRSAQKESGPSASPAASHSGRASCWGSVGTCSCSPWRNSWPR